MIANEQVLYALIYQKGFKSIRDFTQSIEENDPKNALHSGTISNATRNMESISARNLSTIAKQLQVPLSFLLFDTFPALESYSEEDDNFFDMDTLPKYSRNDGKTWAEQLRPILFAYDVNQLTYPTSVFDLYKNYGFIITTLAEFSIFLPLCDPPNIIDVVFRIGGDYENREIYLLEQYRNLYRSIPDSPAKEYANNVVVYSKLSHKLYLSDSEKTALKEAVSYLSSNSANEGYHLYCDIINRWNKFFSDDIISEYIKAIFPEII